MHNSHHRSTGPPPGMTDEEMRLPRGVVARLQLHHPCWRAPGSMVSRPRISPPRCATACWRWLGSADVPSNFLSHTANASAGRADAALAASPRRTAPKRNGHGLHPAPYLVQLRCRKLRGMAGLRSGHYQLQDRLRVQLRPQRPARGCSIFGIHAKAMTSACQRDIPTDSRSPRPHHPVGTRPEHVRCASG